MYESRDLISAAQIVCEAIRRHAAACQQDPDNIATIIQAGEALRNAVLHYEAMLSETAGWSNPIRHLGPLPIFGQAPPSEIEEDVEETGASAVGASTGIVIDAHYELRANAESLVSFVSGRFGKDVFSVTEAVELLYEAEGWDPQQYPARLLAVDFAQADVSITRPPTDA